MTTMDTSSEKPDVTSIDKPLVTSSLTDSRQAGLDRPPAAEALARLRPAEGGHRVEVAAFNSSL
jgi:FXSXX-COOH protein